MRRDKIEALHAMTIDELRARWSKAFQAPPPPRASRDLLLRAVAHRTQEKAHGGLRAATRRRLARLAGIDDCGEAAPRRAPAPRLKPGTRLYRQWRGDVHQVTVLEKGFDYRGITYRSLSAIARTITGTRWSGPRFFGLKAGHLS